MADQPRFLLRAHPAGRLAQLVGLVLSLGWLAFPIVDLVESDPGAGRAVAVGLTLALWLAIYLHRTVRWRPPADSALWWIGVLAAIGVGLTLADMPSWAMLLIYCAANAGIAVRSDLLGAVAIAACTALCGGAVLAAGGEVAVAGSLAATALAVGGLMFAFGRVVRANFALREAREELAERAVDEERLRFARDLHDLLGHDLSVITLKAQLAGRLLDSDAEAVRRELGDVEGVARTALTQVREAVAGYRQPNLATELASARRTLRAAGIACTVEDAEPALPASREAVLAWAVREATTNVVRHSGARSCAIRVAVAGDEACLEVIDDGSGGDAPASGTGLRGLRERAAGEGGRVAAGPRPGGGFGLELHLPLGRPA